MEVFGSYSIIPGTSNGQGNHIVLHPILHFLYLTCMPMLYQWLVPLYRGIIGNIRSGSWRWWHGILILHFSSKQRSQSSCFCLNSWDLLMGRGDWVKAYFWMMDLIQDGSNCNLEEVAFCPGRLELILSMWSYRCSNLYDWSLAWKICFLRRSLLLFSRIQHWLIWAAQSKCQQRNLFEIEERMFQSREVMKFLLKILLLKWSDCC